MQKKQVTAVDLMVSGSGIPWEDRGSIGLVGAFFKTLFGMMFKPVATLSKMRRPETTGDSNSFAYLCAGLWAIGSVVQSLVARSRYASDEGFDPNQYWINTAVEAVAVGVLMAVLARVLGMLFYKLTAFDMATKAPPVLVHNTVNYLMAPVFWHLFRAGRTLICRLGRRWHWFGFLSRCWRWRSKGCG